jgi:hypothetical protein
MQINIGLRCCWVVIFSTLAPIIAHLQKIERRISVPLGIMLGTSLSSQLIRLLEIASLHGDNDH